MVKFCIKSGSPFCINVYPFFARQDVSEDFVLFGPDPGYEDGGLKYTDMFSAQYDAVVQGISKLGVPGAETLEVCIPYTMYRQMMANDGAFFFFFFAF